MLEVNSACTPDGLSSAPESPQRDRLVAHPQVVGVLVAVLDNFEDVTLTVIIILFFDELNDVFVTEGFGVTLPSGLPDVSALE